MVLKIIFYYTYKRIPTNLTDIITVLELKLFSNTPGPKTAIEYRSWKMSETNFRHSRLVILFRGLNEIPKRIENQK